MTEAEFQKQVITLAELYGWKVCHFHDSRRQIRPGVFIGDKQSKGYPDLTLVHQRHGVAWAELKRERGSLRPEQVAWIKSLQRAGQVAFVWRPSNWREIQRFLKDGGPAPVGAGYPPALDQPGSDRAAAPLSPKTPIPPTATRPYLPTREVHA